jgi:hypothetical protein
MAARHHRLAELRSLALHREVARRLRANPALLDGAKKCVESWNTSGVASSGYMRAWQEILNGPFAELLALLERDDEQATALRQASPFLGIIDARRRWEIWRSAGREAS